MVAVQLVFAGLVDHDGLVAGADLVAQGGDQVQLAADLQAKAQRIENRAGRPVAVGDPGDCRKTHAGGLADNLQDGRYCVDTADRGDIGSDGGAHESSTFADGWEALRRISLASNWRLGKKILYRMR
ncbi:hypothetical protein D3C85_1467350 [compost metagenome]